MSYQKILNNGGWSLSEEIYDKSVRKIAEVEPEIILKIKEVEKTCENTKAIEELQVKAGIQKTGGKAKGKHKDKDKRSAPKANGSKNEHGYYLCGNCGNTHKGVCCKPIKSDSSGGEATQNPRKDWMTKKAAKHYIKQMVTSETKKTNKNKKRRYSSSNSGSSSIDEDSWRIGMTGAEQIHMIASAGLDPNDSDIEFESDDEKRYRKQAKKWSKSKVKRRR